MLTTKLHYATCPLELQRPAILKYTLYTFHYFVFCLNYTLCARVAYVEINN